jgi:hypothetical protein
MRAMISSLFGHFNILADFGTSVVCGFGSTNLLHVLHTNKGIVPTDTLAGIGIAIIDSLSAFQKSWNVLSQECFDPHSVRNDHDVVLGLLDEPNFHEISDSIPNIIPRFPPIHAPGIILLSHCLFKFYKWPMRLLYMNSDMSVGK